MAPDVVLVTETNVPHAQNLAYFGDGTNEAKLIYNFALPPLVLHAFHTSQARTLSHWAAGLSLPSAAVMFFNILASHDGIGLNPLRGILEDDEIDAWIRSFEDGGTLVSRRTDADGESSPYEINANYFDALDVSRPDLNPRLKIERFVAAHAIMLALKGLPGIYFHSLFGSRGWPEGVVRSGRARSINREKVTRSQLEADLSDPRSMRAGVFGRLRHLISIRAECPAFSPYADQRVLESQDSVFALVRGPAETEDAVLCVCNVSRQAREVRFDPQRTWGTTRSRLRDLISGREISCPESAALSLAPYQPIWLSTYRTE
jgi:hypothetical protein